MHKGQDQVNIVEVYLLQFLCYALDRNFRKFSETTGPTEAKFHVSPPLDRGKDGKLIQNGLCLCCY